MLKQMKGHIRVFPRRTSHTPTDEWAFVGHPPLWRPDPKDVIDVSVSCTFTWDKPNAELLAESWARYYPVVRIGGPAYGSPATDFVPGRYVKAGVTFTSRGCGRSCGFCLVPEREGRIRLLSPIAEGYIVEDNNFLALPSEHRAQVYEMLKRQPRGAVFSGGLDVRLFTPAIAAEFEALNSAKPIHSLFLACDHDSLLDDLAKTVDLLRFLPPRKRRCYALCGWKDQTIEQAEARLERIWELGCWPYAMLYQSGNEFIHYSSEWKALQRRWTRPALMKATMRACGR